MKYAVILCALLGLCAAERVFDWDRVPEMENTTQCMFNSEKRLLSCRGLSGIVDCEAFGEMERLGDRRFNVFGIGEVRGLEDADDVERRFWLFPRSLDNTTYLNYTIRVGEEDVPLYLYFGEEARETGIRVTELKCYTRLISLLDLITEKHVPVIEGEERRECGLIGEILIVDKELTKKWWGWGYGGYGLWGWPYWGGWGLWGRK